MEARPYQKVNFRRFCQMDAYLGFITNGMSEEVYHSVYEEEVVVLHYKTAQWNEYSSKHPFSD